jgi:hypothetical protein
MLTKCSNVTNDRMNGAPQLMQKSPCDAGETDKGRGEEGADKDDLAA